MKLALEQARRALGNTGQNPSVGCIITNNQHVIGSGHTGFNGRPHAETIAIRSIKKKTINSDIYITLEPCSHFGKTSPCVDKIIKKKFKRVFFSVNDPDYRSFSKSKKIFKKAGIKIHQGLLKTEINNFYKSYFNYKSNRLPYVSSKLAISKDFYLKDKKSKWITKKQTRLRAHYLRYNHDSILTTARTVIDDNPLLNCRIKGLEKFSPSRLIIDKRLEISLSSQIVNTANKYKTIIFYNSKKYKKLTRLKKMGIKTIFFPLDSKKNFNLPMLLKRIKLLGFSRILLEAGANININFAKEKLIDFIYLFISNRYIRKSGLLKINKFVNLINKKAINIKTEDINLSGETSKIFRLK